MSGKYAPGHYDGDGCTFPDPGHFAEKDAPEVQPKFTERQALHWQQIACPILERHGVSTSLSPYSWSIQWSGNPKRGWHFNGTYNDGETFAQVLMEVYGYPSVSVAELDWVHVDQDEELDCETCPTPPEVGAP